MPFISCFIFISFTIFSFVDDIADFAATISLSMPFRHSRCCCWFLFAAFLHFHFHIIFAISPIFQSFLLTCFSFSPMLMPHAADFAAIADDIFAFSFRRLLFRRYFAIRYLICHATTRHAFLRCAFAAAAIDAAAFFCRFSLPFTLDFAIIMLRFAASSPDVTLLFSLIILFSPFSIFASFSFDFHYFLSFSRFHWRSLLISMFRCHIDYFIAAFHLRLALFARLLMISSLIFLFRHSCPLIASFSLFSWYISFRHMMPLLLFIFIDYFYFFICCRQIFILFCRFDLFQPPDIISLILLLLRWYIISALLFYAAVMLFFFLRWWFDVSILRRWYAIIFAFYASIFSPLYCFFRFLSFSLRFLFSPFFLPCCFDWCHCFERYCQLSIFAASPFYWWYWWFAAYFLIDFLSCFLFDWFLSLLLFFIDISCFFATLLMISLMPRIWCCRHACHYWFSLRFSDTFISPDIDIFHWLWLPPLLTLLILIWFRYVIFFDFRSEMPLITPPFLSSPLIFSFAFVHAAPLMLPPFDCWWPSFSLPIFTLLILMPYFFAYCLAYAFFHDVYFHAAFFRLFSFLSFASDSEDRHAI